MSNLSEISDEELEARTSSLFEQWRARYKFLLDERNWAGPDEEKDRLRAEYSACCEEQTRRMLSRWPGEFNW